MMKFDSETEMYADNLSDVSGDEYFSNSGDSDIFVGRRNRALPLPSSSDNDSDNEPDWSENDNAPVIENFRGESGITVNLNNLSSAIDFLKLFVNDDLFEYMAKETNRYHAQNIHHFKDSPHSLKWKDVSVREQKKMVGLLLLMGQVRKDARDEYWSTDKTIETPIFAKVLSRDRFRQVWNSWHFSNNDEADLRADRLQKINPLLDYFLPKFKEVYKPKRELSLDESIMPWRGRLCFKIYNASKLNKYGILIRMVCEATSGYICNFNPLRTERSSPFRSSRSALDSQVRTSRSAQISLVAYPLGSVYFGKHL